MTRGRVYLWTQDPGRGLYGRLAASVEPLLRLEASAEERTCLSGRFVAVQNAGAVYEPDSRGAGARIVPLGDAQPDTAGNFLFEPGRGGGRMDKVIFAEPGFRWRYVQASRFGEVNTYFHIDRIAAHVHSLLSELGEQGLPRVTAVVTAHHAATEQEGVRDGVRGRNHWLPFQGGHYRLPSRRHVLPEHRPLAPTGEIHLGPGWQLLTHGALVDVAGGRYRANASHNAGIIYHEYGHHLTRHTADFQANALRPEEQQSNRKTVLDEGTCDYWAATILGTPHIWILHRRHDDEEIHFRSLASSKTMANYDHVPGADVHVNGTIWGAALWDFRTRLQATEPDGARQSDLLVVKALLLIGRVFPQGQKASVRNVRLARRSFQTGLTALLTADELLHAGRHRKALLETFADRGIWPAPRFRPGRNGEFFVETLAA